MREEAGGEEPSWFARWEEELPTPDELMPLSQTLITPHLALAFDIPTHNTNNNNHNHHHLTNSNSIISNSAPPPPSSLHHHHHHHHHLPPPSDFDSADLGSSGGGASGGDEQARTLKRPRLVWTPQLHKRFVDAVAHLGIKNAVPKTIMQLMSVDGLTRENVASHLQKYRLYLKRMQGLSSAAVGASAAPISAADDHLFSTGPIPHHFLSRGGVGPEPPYVPFVPMAALQQHHQQMAAAAAAAAAAQQQFYHQRQIGHFGSAAAAAAAAAAAGNGGGGGFDHGFLTRTPPPQAGLHRMGPSGLHSIVQPMTQGPNTNTAASYVDDLEERSGTGGRKVLTLFPTGED